MGCIATAKQETSTGVISNLNARVSSHHWLFDHVNSGDSYYMNLSESKNKMNVIGHYSQGIQQYVEDISCIQSDDLRTNQKVKFILDFNQYEIVFFIDSIQTGKPMKIRANTTYYAVFEFLDNCQVFASAAAYRICETPSFP